MSISQRFAAVGACFFIVILVAFFGHFRHFAPFITIIIFGPAAFLIVTLIIIGACREAEVVCKVLDEPLERVLGNSTLAIQPLPQIVSVPVHLEVLPLLCQVFEFDSACRAGLCVGDQLMPLLLL